MENGHVFAMGKNIHCKKIMIEKSTSVYLYGGWREGAYLWRFYGQRNTIFKKE